MKLDRKLQNEILHKLAEAYPDMLHLLSSADNDDENEKIIANLLYLEEHGLVFSGVERSITGAYICNSQKIYAKGIDFITNDGGLSAILGVVTIKLHSDTLEALLSEKIKQSDLPEPKKSQFLEIIKSLPAAVAKELTKKLVETAVSHAPDALQIIEMYLSQLLK